MRRFTQPLPLHVTFFLWLGLTLGTSFGQGTVLASGETVGQVSPARGVDSCDSSTQSDSTDSTSSSSTGGNTPRPVQAPPVPSPHSKLRDFAGTFLSDEKAIWTSPLHAKPKDLRWLVPLVATTGILFATDTDISNGLPNTEDQINISRWVSRIGASYTLAGVGGAFYLVGRIGDHDRLRETGWLSLMALTHSQIVVGILKVATGRERPVDNDGEGRFWKGKNGFPSGHAISSWAFASVVAAEYHDQPLIQIGAYSLATIVSVSRVTARRHFPSDVVAGGAMGFLIGHYMVRIHRGSSDFTGRPKLGTLLTPQVAPQFDRSARSYGIALNWNF